MSKFKVPKSFATFVRTVCKKDSAPAVAVGDLSMGELVKIDETSVRRYFWEQGHSTIPPDFMELLRNKRKDLLSAIQASNIVKVLALQSCLARINCRNFQAFLAVEAGYPTLAVTKADNNSFGDVGSCTMICATLWNSRSINRTIYIYLFRIINT